MCDKEDCCVCLSSREKFILSPCRHPVCVSCSTKLKSKNTCPVCRQSLLFYDLNKHIKKRQMTKPTKIEKYLSPPWERTETVWDLHGRIVKIEHDTIKYEFFLWRGEKFDRNILRYLPSHKLRLMYKTICGKTPQPLADEMQMRFFKMDAWRV